MGLSPVAQATILGEAVDADCNGNRAFYMGMDKELNAYWSVGCANGRRDQVSIKPDKTGHTETVDCLLMKKIRVNCSVRLKDQ